MATYYVYILECTNGAFYTGYTTDIKRRYAEHCAGSKKCKYTRAFPPTRIAASWKFDANLSLALRVEAFLKKLSRAEKQLLIEKPDLLSI